MLGDLRSTVFDTGLDAITNAGDSSIVEDDTNNGDVILDDDNITAIDVEISGKCNEEVGEGSVLLRTSFPGVVFATLVLGSIRKGEDVHKTLLIWVDNMVTPGTEADVIISPEDVIARCLEVIALSGVIKS